MNCQSDNLSVYDWNPTVHELTSMKLPKYMSFIRNYDCTADEKDGCPFCYCQEATKAFKLTASHTAFLFYFEIKFSRQNKYSGRMGQVVLHYDNWK